jgi:hypothetical protein
MGNGALPHGLSSKAVWPPGDPARMAVRIIESVDVESAPLRMVLGSQALEVRRNLMRGQPRFSVWVAFPFTLHSICLASGRGLPYHFRGLAGRCCSCLYSFPRSRVHRFIRRGPGIQLGLTSYEGAFIIGCHFLGCNYLGIVVCLTGSKGEKLHCD